MVEGSCISYFPSFCSISVSVDDSMPRSRKTIEAVKASFSSFNLSTLDVDGWLGDVIMLSSPALPLMVSSLRTIAMSSAEGGSWTIMIGISESLSACGKPLPL